MSSEFSRYKEYLQRVLMTADWQQFVAEEARGEKESFATFVARLNQCNVNTEGLVETQAALRKAHPVQTAFDQVDLSDIFHPVLKRVQQAAASVGFITRLPIELATSTEGAPGPVTRFAGDRHLIFIGAGTGKFANGWATAYTDAADNMHRTGAEQSSTPLMIWDIAQRSPAVASYALVLARHYALHGTIVTAPVLEPTYERHHLAHRSALLDAMELFVVGHEYGHCFAEETIGTASSHLTPAEARQLELDCDLVGLTIARVSSSDPQNFHAYCGVGAALFLRAVQLCEHARLFHLSGATEPVESPTHPTINDRLAGLRRHIHEATPAEHQARILAIFDYYDDLACAVNTVIVNLLVGLKEKGKL